MPIVPYNPAGLTPVQDFASRIRSAVPRPSPLAPVDAPPGWIEAAGRSLQTDSIVGSFFAHTVPNALEDIGASTEQDPAFDVLKFNTPDFFASHPYMVAPFQSGEVVDIPNEDRFWTYVQRREDDWNVRQRMGMRGWGANLLASLPGQALDWLTAGAAARAVGLGAAADAAGEWASSGPYWQRALKSAGMFGAVNLGADEALRALNPNRNVDERQAAIWAVTMGLTFGAGSAAMAGGLRKLGGYTPTRTLKAVQREVAEGVAAPAVADLLKQGELDAAALREELGVAAPAPEPVPGALTPYDTAEIVAARAEQAGRTDTIGISTPDRIQLRKQIADELYGEGAARKERTAYVVIGPPAAGKSSVAVEPLTREVGALVIDADAAKERLPEFGGGIGATAVHKESSSIVEHVLSRAEDAGDNLVLPILGKSADKVQETAARLRLHGYTPHLILVDVPADEAAARAAQRFASSGRFVDPAYVLNTVRDNPARAYDATKGTGAYDSYTRISNAVPRGERPRIIEQLGTPAEARAVLGRPGNGSGPAVRDEAAGDNGPGRRAPVNPGGRAPASDGAGSPAARVERPLKKADVYRALKDEIPEFILSPGHAGKRVRTSLPDVLKSLATHDEESQYGGAAVSDRTRLMALVGYLDKSGELGEAGGRKLAGLDGSKLAPGDTWLLDGRWELEVVEAGEDTLTIRATDHNSALPVGGGEDIEPPSYEYTVPRDTVIPANEGTLYRAAEAPAGEADPFAEFMEPNAPGPETVHAGHETEDTDRFRTILRTPETEPLIQRLQMLRPDVELLEHPQQAAYDWARQLKELEATAAEAQPADFGVAGKVAGVLARGVPVQGFENPAVRLMKAPALLARKAGRLLFDFAWPTRETVESPLNAHNAAPAEGLKWNYNAWHDEAFAAMDKALRDGLASGPFSYTFEDGTSTTIGSRVFGRDNFGRAVADYLRRVDRFSRGRGDEPEAPAPIVKAAQALRVYFRKMGGDLVDVNALDTLDPDRVYITRRWLADRIRLNTTDFKRKLVDAFRRNREEDFNTGAPIEPLRRPLVDEVVNHTRKADRVQGGGLSAGERETIRGLAPEGDVSKLTEADLAAHDHANPPLFPGESLLNRYRQEVDLYHQRAADAVVRRLTGLDGSSGVEHAGDGPIIGKGRALDIEDAEFAPYLENNAFRLLDAYDHAVSGRLAARMALKRAAGEWGPIIRDQLGKDVAEEGYNPGLLVEAVKREFQAWIDALQGDRPRQAKFEAAMAATVGENGILPLKLAELEGRPLFNGNPAAESGFGLFVRRNALKFPYMASLGKMTISAFTDLAGLALYRRTTARQLGELGRALNLLKALPLRRNLEGVYVATADMARSLRAMELGDVPGRIEEARFGPGMRGKVLAGLDSATDWLNHKFTSATLMNRWNTNLKRATATIVMDEVLSSARKLARAADLVDGGASQADALARVGLSPQDAGRLARLTISPDRARRLSDVLFEHGVDWEGNRPWGGDRGAFDAYDGFVHPEMRAWAGADRDLADALLYAVNAETMNVIVEPKLLSRPLVNARFWGRLVNQFQSFTNAWGAQLAPIAVQRPGSELLMYMGLVVGLGAIQDALHNALSGRRDLDTTADLWQSNPLGMMYGAVNRAGLPGWMGRPLGLLEQTPWGIGKALGNGSISTVYGRPSDRENLVADQLGPFFGWANNVAQPVFQSMYDGGWNTKTQRQLWSALPFRNLWALEGFNRMAESAGYDTPLGPPPRPVVGGAR